MDISLDTDPICYRSDYYGYYNSGGETDYYNQHQQRYRRGYEDEMRQYEAAGYVRCY